MRIESDIFKIAPSVLVKSMVYCYGKAWIILICCLILAGIIAGFFDWRYIMVALIAVCFVIPLVMMFMYYDYGLRPYSYFNSVHHRLIFDETDILIEVYVKEYQDDQKEELWFGKKEDSWFGKKEDSWFGKKQDEVVEKEDDSVSRENKNSDSESSSKNSALILRSTIKIPLVDVLPYYIYGDKYGHGNEEVPLRAYVKVFREIQNQADDIGIEFDYIFLATGTGMTQAGMIAGSVLYGSKKEKMIGISVSREKARQENILNDMLSAYSMKNNVCLNDGYIEVCDEYISDGYGKYNEDIINTIKTMMISNGIPLDPTYTGKAFWGMLQYTKSREIEGKNILFIHTGGTPLFFDSIRLIK